MLIQALMCILKCMDIHSSLWVYIAWFIDSVHIENFCCSATAMWLCCFVSGLAGFLPGNEMF